MSDLGRVWKFTRYRLDQAYHDLSDEQLAWRPFDGAHSGHELLYHIAGAEHYWAARMLGKDPKATAYEAKLDVAVLDGFLRDGGCPFPSDELTKKRCEEALAFTAAEIGPIFEAMSEEHLSRRMISPVGDDVNGHEGLTRLAQHAGYHTGQLWVYRMDPRFPQS